MCYEKRYKDREGINIEYVKLSESVHHDYDANLLLFSTFWCDLFVEKKHLQHETCTQITYARPVVRLR